MVEHAAAMSEMSFPKKPRSGQWSVIEECKNRLMLNAKLPTGYGKTLAACYVYSIKQRLGLANRLLVIFPSDSQLEQFVRDGHRDLRDAGVSGPVKIIDVRHAGARAVRDHRKNLAQVYVITIQSLIESRGFQNVTDLLETGQWMIVVDEYHHYGIEKAWGRTALGLNRSFLLAMSATPTRPGDDSAFGQPHVTVKYRDAVDEGAIKRLVANAYSYRIETTNEETLQTQIWTTEELTREAGGDAPETIERLRIRRKMRWSPRYVSPLVSIPIERMIKDRIATGHNLQVHITAMCVSHAQIVCEQVKTLYPELRVDWVGTGLNGRPSEENEDVLKRFCPPKDDDGIRHPELDVLVHVGMAGEGLDSIHVSEIVLLCNASICNRILQIIGRGARNLPGVECHVSFDSSSEFAAKKYVGSAIMDAMDFDPPLKEDDDEGCDDGDDEWPPEPPADPDIRIENIELLHIDTGNEGVQRMARVLEQHGADLDFAAMRNDPAHPHWQTVINDFRTMRKIELEGHDERAIVEQWREKVKYATINLASIVVLLLKKNGRQIDNEKQLRGAIKHAINNRKMKMFGAVENDADILKKHYGWCVALDRDLRERKSLPSWLSL
jgi:superfamily II DNA or RNA helicase